MFLHSVVIRRNKHPNIHIYIFYYLGVISNKFHDIYQFINYIIIQHAHLHSTSILLNTATNLNFYGYRFEIPINYLIS